MCGVFVASSERGPAISILDDAVNDLGYLERPTSVIEKYDRQYGWAIAIEREELESIRVHFAMSDLERQTLAGIGRPMSVEEVATAAPLEAIDELHAAVAEARRVLGSDATSMPVLEFDYGDETVLFASPRVLMRHCPDVNALAEIYHVDGVYVVLEGC